MTSLSSINSPLTLSNDQLNIENKEGANSSKIRGRKTAHLSKNSFSITILKIILIFSLFFQLTHALSWQCPEPKGTFLESCRGSGQPYKSDDPNLRNYQFCKYTYHCKKVNKPDTDTRKNEKILTVQDVQCSAYWVNCHGNLVVGEKDKPICTTKESIKSELKKHGLHDDL